MKVTITSDAIPAALSGRELVGKTLTAAPGRAVIALQEQTGWKLAEIREHADNADALGGFVIAFLTLHAAGYPIRWDDVLDKLSMEAIQTELDEDEKRQQAEALAEQEASAADPQQARTDSRPGDSAELDNASVAETTDLPRSSSTSRGSSSRSRDE